MAKSKKKSTKKAVIKEANWIVQETYNDFTASQNKIIKIIINRCADLKENVVYDSVIPIKDFLDELGLTDGKPNYIMVRNAVEALAQSNSVKYRMRETNTNAWKTVYIPHFRRIELTDDNLSVAVFWEPEIMEFINGKDPQFTQFYLREYLNLGTVAAQNLYELLKSYQNYEEKYHREPEFEVEYLQKKLNYKGKTEFSKFRQKCLDIAINKINELTDLEVVMTPDRPSRKVVGCKFSIKQKNPPVHYLGCWFENQSQVNKLVYHFKAKDMIYRLKDIKANNPEKYQDLQDGGKTDYDIIMMWINNERIVQNVEFDSADLDEDKPNETIAENEEQERIFLLKQIEEIQRRGN